MGRLIAAWIGDPQAGNGEDLMDGCSPGRHGWDARGYCSAGRCNVGTRGLRLPIQPTHGQPALLCNAAILAILTFIGGELAVPQKARSCLPLMTRHLH